MSGLSPDLYGARVARRRLARQKKRLEEQNTFHGQNAIAGPSRIPSSSNLQTPAHYFPQLSGGGDQPTREFNELTPQSPNSRDHRGKRIRVPVPESPLSPFRSGGSMDIDPDFQIRPLQLFRNISGAQLSRLTTDVFGSSPIQTPPILPRRHVPPTTPNSPGRHNQARGHKGKQPHPTHKDLLWCTKQGHWVHKDLFFMGFYACDRCSTLRIENARARKEQAATAAAAAAALQEQLEAQIGQDPNLEPPGIPPDAPPAGDEPMHIPNPLAEPAVSAADKPLMKQVRDKIMEITLEECQGCDERWFDLNVKNGNCDKCRARGAKRDKFQASNAMNPGPDILPPLTQMEEMIISPVHALVSLYQIRGGQFKYSGHCCNFIRNNAVFHNKLPLLPEECDVIVMRRTGLDPLTNEDVHQDFRIRWGVVEKWLDYLELNHPTFQSRQVTIDRTRLGDLPEDASVRDRLRTVESQTIPEPNQDAGPPEQGENPQDQEPLFTRGFVPNVSTAQTEMEQLHAAAFTMMPLGQSIAINAFPSLFPNGKADFAAERETKVTMTEWAAHMLRFKDGRFARHPRFRYWALNTVMRHDAKKASQWFTTTHKDDKELDVEEIRQMLEENNAQGLADRVAHAGVNLPGSRPF
ncbi:hypothetical protein B0H13DRAFT_1892031 [Mycena leptocephala]|nr:hypothetical protein B0H13DRAFT_1892031 [Mycena leptocephala]